jgi:hypothetical protein
MAKHDVTKELLKAPAMKAKRDAKEEVNRKSIWFKKDTKI